MIYINLLPYHMRPIKRTPLPYVICILVCIIAICGMGLNYVSTQGEIAKVVDEKLKNKAELDKLGDIVAEYQQLTDKKRLLADKIATIKEIVSDRIVWSRQLWNLSRLAPDTLWFNSIAVETKKYTEERIETDSKGKAVKKSVSITKPILKVSGYVVESAGEGVRKGVNPFIDATSEDLEFASMYTLDIVDIKSSETVDGVKATGFTMEYIINTGGAK